MYDALSCSSVVKNAVSVFVHSGENVSLFNEGSLDFNFVFYEKGLDDFPSPARYGRSRFVTTTPVSPAVAARVKEVFLSLAFLFSGHLSLQFQKWERL